MKHEIEQIRCKLKKIQAEYAPTDPESFKKFLNFKKEIQKSIFQLKIRLAELLLKENKQIADENTISLSIPEEHTCVRKLTQSQKMIFDINHRELVGMEHTLAYLVDLIRKKDADFGRELNTEELNAFYTCLYESVELNILFNLTLNKTQKNG